MTYQRLFKDEEKQQSLPQQQQKQKGRWKIFSAFAGRGSQEQLQVHSKWEIFSAVLFQGLLRGYSARKNLQVVKSRTVNIQSVVRGRQQRHKYSWVLKNVIVIQSAIRKGRASSKFKREVRSIIIIQSMWRMRMGIKAAKEVAYEAAVESAFSNRPHIETRFDSMFDDMNDLLGDEEDDEFQKQSFHALIIQEGWRDHSACRALISMRKKAVRYQSVSPVKEKNLHFDTFAVILIQANWRRYPYQREFLLLKSSAVTIQTMVRAKFQHHRYGQQLEKSLIIQSFLRKYWIRMGKVYIDQREVFVHSTPMGTQLQRGRDSFVRVLSVVTEGEATADSLSIIRVGDMVMEADGVNLRLPLTKDQWRHAFDKIRNAPRPTKFVVACDGRRMKAQLMAECKLVLIHLQSLLSVVKIQRVWRKRCHMKRVSAASLVIQSYARRWLACSLRDRKLETAVLLAECEAILLQLKHLRAATVIQTYVRQWIAHSSFSSVRKSTIHIQGFIRTEFQKRRYKLTLTNVAMIQGIARGWLVRRRNLRETSPVQQAPSLSAKLMDQIVHLSAVLLTTDENSHAWIDIAEDLATMQEGLRRAREMESRHDTEHSRSNGELKENSLSKQDQREGNEDDASAPIFPQDDIQSASKASASNPTQRSSTVESPVTRQAQEKEDSQGSPEIHNFASLRQNLEAAATVPIFPQNEVEEKTASPELPQAPVPEVRAGEVWSPKNELRNISVAKFQKNLENSNSDTSESDSLLDANLALTESTQGSGTKKQATPEEDRMVSTELIIGHRVLSTNQSNFYFMLCTIFITQKTLGIECLRLSHRMKSLPKFSPEWSLAKMEMKFISEELEFLYAESVEKGAQ